MLRVAMLRVAMLRFTKALNSPVTYRMAYRQACRHTHRQACRHTHKQACRLNHGQAYRQTPRQTQKQAYRQTEVQTDIQTETQTDTQTGIHTLTQTGIQTDRHTDRPDLCVPVHSPQTCAGRLCDATIQTGQRYALNASHRSFCKALHHDDTLLPIHHLKTCSAPPDVCNTCLWQTLLSTWPVPYISWHACVLDDDRANVPCCFNIEHFHHIVVSNCHSARDGAHTMQNSLGCAAKQYTCEEVQGGVGCLPRGQLEGGQALQHLHVKDSN